MCDDWRPAERAPRGMPMILRLANGEICGGRREEDGTFRRSHGNREVIEPEAWASMPAEMATFTRLRYERRNPDLTVN